VKFLDRFGIWVILAAGAILRLWNLGYPHKLVFDETYYVKDAWTLSEVGHELAWPANPNKAFESGDVDGFLDTPSYVVHPPLGKWIIAIGMRIFGAENSFGWRISVAVIGIAMIYLTYAVARRVLDSSRWGLFVAGLFAMDGAAIVMARTGLLDTILAFFALLGFYFLLRDHERHNDSFWRRPWLMAMAVALGAATAVKWSGVYFLAAFCLYVVGRYAIKTRHVWDTIHKAVTTFFITVPLALFTYLASWSGWFFSDGGYGKDADSNPFIALWKYHVNAYNFHVNLTSSHPYEASPFTWLFMVRPTSFFYESCGNGCSTAITAIGNPLIWWAGAVAVIATFLGWVTKRDRTSALVLIGLVGGFVPWLFFSERTVFWFYTIAFEVWVLLAIALLLKRTVELSDKPERVKRWIWVFVWACVAVSIFFVPIWWGTEIPYWFWLAHMWLPSWI
jgi:dolichyl-phosphate-mannose--protein O-mannosyl transferase